MLEALGKIMYNVQFGPHERKVKRYLDESTRDSILEDLGKILSLRLKAIRNVESIFSEHCLIDSGERSTDWTNASLKNHIEANNPRICLRKSTFDVLWRCFSFYAYHPFPRHSIDNNRVDINAFQRAVALLAAQGTDLLGTQEDGDYLWRENDDFFHNADSRRILRSISLPTKDDSNLTSMISDAMDVIAMTQPHMVCLAPSPDLLEPAARRLLESIPLQKGYKLYAGDLSILIVLLLRLRLCKEKWGPWGSRFHFGGFDQPDPRYEGLARGIEEGIFEQENAESDKDSRVMDVLPNLRIQFYQLWSVLFQPTKSEEEKVQPPEIPKGIPSSILQAISLFIPQAPVSRGTPAPQDHRIVFSQATQQSVTSNNLSLARLLKSLEDEPYSHLVLLTGETPLNILGAYFPGPLCSSGGEFQECKTGPSHLLFRLAPEFRLLRWAGLHIPLLRIISAENECHPLATPYRIGDPGGASIWVDPENRSATLTWNTTMDACGNESWYENMCQATRESFNSETTKIDRLFILRVCGGLNADLAFEHAVKIKDLARYSQQTNRAVIRGEELRKRIMGFGST